MPFKDSKEGQTHYQNDGCGEPAHNTEGKRKPVKVCLCPNKPCAHDILLEDGNTGESHTLAECTAGEKKCVCQCHYDGGKNGTDCINCCFVHRVTSHTWQEQFIKTFFVYKLGGKHPDHVGAEKEAVAFISELLESARAESLDHAVRIAEGMMKNPEETKEIKTKLYPKDISIHNQALSDVVAKLTALQEK